MKSNHEEILEFIENYRTCWGEFPDDAAETVRRLHRNGFCWHFAQMLKVTFERGEVCWAAPFAHMVWVDEDGTPYDIEGTYVGEAIYFIPEYYIRRYIQDFKHIPGQVRISPTETELIHTVQRYCHDQKLAYDAYIERLMRHESR